MNDDAFIKKFEAGEISKQDWTHRAHIRMAYIYLQNYSLIDSTEKIRNGIKSLINSQGVDVNQFHETLTIAWIKLIQAMIKVGQPCKSSEDFFRSNPQLLERHSIYFFYSVDRIKSEEARATYLKPDLTDFPGAPN